MYHVLLEQTHPYAFERDCGFGHKLHHWLIKGRKSFFGIISNCQRVIKQKKDCPAFG